MRYLGMDVHSSASVWCLLDEKGEEVGRGKTATVKEALQHLVSSMAKEDELLVGQEVGTMSHYVHDAVTDAGVRILSFNAHHLRMISSSRKKTDRRDAYWIAKALQTGMMPHPVYIPQARERRLRSILSMREGVKRERYRWLVRGRSYLRAAGIHGARGASAGRRMLRVVLDRPEGRDPQLVTALTLCDRHYDLLTQELKEIDGQLVKETQEIDEVRRLMTIPSVGRLVAATIYAQVGDVTRFRNARALSAYSGLVTSVWQSGESQRSGHITKQGSPALRKMLVQAAQVLLARCRSSEAAPLQAIAARVYQSRHRKKIAIVAMARHILRLAYYILRDGTVYDPKLLCRGAQEEKIGETAEQDSQLTTRLNRSPQPGKHEGARPQVSLDCHGQSVR